MLTTWKFWRAALVRAARTAAEAALAYIGSAKLAGDVSWPAVGSAALLGAIVSLLLAVATGLPEAQNERGDQSVG